MDLINIGILGGSFCCPNFGVGALTISQCMILNNVARKLGTKFNVVCYEAIIKNDYLQEFDNLNISLDTHTMNLPLMRMKLRRHDIVIDIYGGDSFSDIYSIKGFLLGAVQRLISLNHETKYILAPQTIGPFRNKISQIIANCLNNRAEQIFCRDKLSMGSIQEKHHYKVRNVTDMAFMLPFSQIEKKEGVAFNVSGLLWNSQLLEGKSNDYKIMVRKTIQYCVDRNINITLLPHVNDSGDSPDGDYYVSKMLYKEFNGKVKLSPQFRNPVEAKTYISQFSLFIGSRMHATIGAVSMGIPTIAIAYSRKFKGLYGELDYPYVIEKDSLNADNVILMLESMINDYESVEKNVLSIREKALGILGEYEEYLFDVVKEMI